MIFGGTMLAGRGESSVTSTAEPYGCGCVSAVRILGIGGAGCNVVEQFCGHPDLPRPLRIGRTGEGRPLDLRLGSDLDAGLSNDDRGRLALAVASAELTIVVAGLGGNTGSYVAPYVATLARRSGGRCVQVYCLPFSFEGEERRARSLRVLTEHNRAVDQLRIFSHDERLQDLPFDVILARTDAAMVSAVRTVVSNHRASDRRL